MKIELKKFKHSRSLSRETEAFTADLWINDTKVGSVLSDGGGGCCEIHIPDRDISEAFAAYVRSLLPETIKLDGHPDFTIDRTEDNFIADLADKLITEAEERRKTVFKLDCFNFRRVK